MSQTGPRPKFLTRGGDVIAPCGIFEIDFPPKSDPPILPNVGPHVGVVLEVQPPHLIIIYGESECGRGSNHIIDPGTEEGYAFEPWMTHRTFFRDDTAVVLHSSVLGKRLGRCLATPTLVQLREVMQRGARAHGHRLNVSWFQLPQPTLGGAGAVRRP